MGIPIAGGFADVEESSFEAIPSGKYAAVVFTSTVKAAGDEAKYPGNDYIQWEFNITEEGYSNRKQWYNTPLVTTPKAQENRVKILGMLKGFLKGCGFTTEELDADDFELDPETVYGREVTLVVGIRQYQGEDRNNVKRVEAAGNSGGADAVLP